MVENMTTQRTRNPGAFGEVLEELMRARDLEPYPENVRRLAARSGLDGTILLRSMIAEEAEDLGPLTGLDTELDLSYEEMRVLALAYVYSEGTAADARAAARKRKEGARCS
jgi:hypothetical protein